MVRPSVLQGESLIAFNEGIGFILSRWSALQTAVDYKWGGDDSHIKAEQLIADVRFWFTIAQEPLYVGDLKTLINDGMSAAFDLTIKDGSDEDIIEELMLIREECLNGDFKSVENLREASRIPNFYPRVEKLVGYCPEEFGMPREHSTEGTIEDINMDVSEVNSYSVNKPNNEVQSEVTLEAFLEGLSCQNKKNGE